MLMAVACFVLSHGSLFKFLLGTLDKNIFYTRAYITKCDYKRWRVAKKELSSCAWNNHTACARFFFSVYLLFSLRFFFLFFIFAILAAFCAEPICTVWNRIECGMASGLLIRGYVSLFSVAAITYLIGLCRKKVIPFVHVDDAVLHVLIDRVIMNRGKNCSN